MAVTILNLRALPSVRAFLGAVLLSLTLSACASESPSDSAEEGLPPHSPGVDPGAPGDGTLDAADALFGTDSGLLLEDDPDQSADPRRAHVIALIAPLTGPHSSAGQALLEGAQMALFDLGNSEAVLVPFDSEGTPMGAARAMTSALEAGAGLVVGPLLAQSVDAVRPLAVEAGIEVIAFSNSPDVAGPPIYLAGYTPPAQVARAIDHAISEGRTRIAVLAPQGAYGDAVLTAAQTVLAEYRTGQRLPPPDIAAAIEAGLYANPQGASATAPALAANLVPGLIPTGDAPPAPIDLARIAYYDPGAPDHSDVIQRFSDYQARRGALNRLRKDYEDKPDDPAAKATLKRLETLDTLGDPPFDAVLLASLSAQNLKILAAQLAYYDVDEPAVRLLGLQPWDGFGDLSGEPTLLGARYVATPDTYRQQFATRFSDIYGRLPSRLASLGYDVTAMGVSLAARGEEPARFTPEAITNQTGFLGAEGLFRFRADGLNERGLAVVEITREGPRTVDDAPQSFPDPVPEEPEFEGQMGEEPEAEPSFEEDPFADMPAS